MTEWYLEHGYHTWPQNPNIQTDINQKLTLLLWFDSLCKHEEKNNNVLHKSWNMWEW